MLSSRQLSPLIVLSIALWVIGALLAGADLTLAGNLLRPIGPVLFVVGTVLTAFDLWLWHCGILYPWFVDRPDLRGTWRATFVSSYVPPGENEPVGPLEARIVIRQTFSSLHIRMLTAESSSNTVGATVSREPDGSHLILGVYQNRPREEVTPRSSMHVGAMWLAGDGRLPDVLRGFYWTNRATRGDLTLGSRERELLSSFEPTNGDAATDEGIH